MTRQIDDSSTSELLGEQEEVSRGFFSGDFTENYDIFEGDDSLEDK